MADAVEQDHVPSLAAVPEGVDHAVVFGAPPRQLGLRVGREHGRTIPLAVIRMSKTEGDRLRSATVHRPQGPIGTPVPSLDAQTVFFGCSPANMAGHAHHDTHWQVLHRR